MICALSNIFRYFCLFVWCIRLATHVQCDPSLPLPSEQIDTELFLDSYSAYNHYTVNNKENNATSLVYITPWNKHGYEVAVTFGNKFDLISPVWFQITNKKKRYTIAGIHDVDVAWLQKVRVVNPNVRIVPRFIFTEWQAEDFRNLMINEADKRTVMANVLRILQNYKFDGAVVEIWSSFVGPSQRNHYLYFSNIPGRFDEVNMKQLSSHVDYFSLMTYDYSPPSQPGPNSPIDWVKECVSRLVPESSPNMDKKRSQILMGLNFYGMHHVPERHFGDAILGHQFVEVVRAHRTNFTWDTETAEHFIRFKDAENLEHIIFYPTLMSVARRLALANQLGVGISIWEIGQGLDSFYSLL